MNSELKNIKINFKKIGFFRFKKLDKKYLLTNDFGFFIFLTPFEFKNFLEGKLNQKIEIYKELNEKGFLKNISSFEKEKLINIYQQRNSSLFHSGPSLHIIVVTLRCNQKCIYCQASSRTLNEKKYDMTLDTAKQTVDFIFKMPVSFFTIEFQGGEPLLNWPIVKFITIYAREKAKKEGKKIKIVLVSNLILMTKEKLKFLIKNEVQICTSLDGPEKIHNKNRSLEKNNNYKIVTHWIKIIREKMLKRKIIYHFGALVTISKHSLLYPKEIIDEYSKLGFRDIHLRPLSYLGIAKTFKKKIGYSAKEFIDFWKTGMDYIISINKNGAIFSEREANIILQKILTNKDPGYTDLKSPCGAALGQILYNYNGNIYTCDEGRMLENDTFLIGNVEKNNYREVISNNKVITMCAASCLENLSCDYCVYKPYCGVCPVKNYVYYGNIFPQMKNTDWCKIYTARFDYLFRKLRNKKIKEIFQKWVLKI